jgi:hypothetical protein
MAIFSLIGSDLVLLSSVDQVKLELPLNYHLAYAAMGDLFISILDLFWRFHLGATWGLRVHTSS